jgi:Lrp/AsnC family transcriptional regulator, leucine-responsive regulatory protein
MILGKIMDEKDRLLLSLLRKNARSSFVELARDLGLSRSATQDRLARLKSSGAIAAFTIVEHEVNVAAQTAHLLIRFDPKAKCAQVVPRLKQIPLITVIHSIAGDVDLLIRVDAPDLASLEATRAAISQTQGIAAATTLMTLERHSG